MTIGGRPPQGRVTGPRIRGSLPAVDGRQVAPARNRDITVTATFDPSGGGVAISPGPDPGRRWRILRSVSTTTETIGSAEVRHYRRTVSDATFLDGSDYARSDVSELVNPIVLDPSEPLVTVWDLATPGQTGTVTFTVVDEPA